MNRSEQDALETAEHLKRHSFEAKTNRRLDEIEAYMEGRKNTAHLREVMAIFNDGMIAVKSPIHTREEACWEWHHQIDLNLDSFGSNTKRLMMRLFDFV